MVGWSDMEQNEQMKERIRNVLTTLTAYRARDLENARIEAIMTQLEFLQQAVENSRQLTHGEKSTLDFNFVEGLPFETNEELVGELYSIRNYAMNTL